MPSIFDLQREIERLNADNSTLHIEISRLEHALTSVDVLKATLEIPKVVIYNETNDLTPKETEILSLIMTGASTHEMAKILFSCESTVKTHIQKIYKKLDVHNRGGAATAGAHLGLDITAA